VINIDESVNVKSEEDVKKKKDWQRRIKFN
jgi:hypothetical protein